MAKSKAYNIWNVDEIDAYLVRFVVNPGDVDPGQLINHMKRALSKALRKEESCLQRLTELPENPPSWLEEQFNTSSGAADNPVYTFMPNGQMTPVIEHIKDWIHGAMVDREDWLDNVDEKGRPHKLLKIGSLAQATAEADKAMRQKAQQSAGIKEKEGDTQTVMDFEDGYRIAQLFTPEALDRESGQMGHCVGHGAYDQSLKTGRIQIYSLRDPMNKSHATFEVVTNRNSLTQCKGKENKPPVSKYFPYVQKFVTERQFKLQEKPAHTGLIEQDGVYYDIMNLPESLHWRGNLDLMDSAVTELPNSLYVDGSFSLYNNTAIQVLPKNLKVGNTLNLCGTKIVALPETLEVGGDFELLGTAITELPTGLKVGGYLDLRQSAIKKLPKGLKVGSHLALSDTDITELPKGLQVGGSLYLSNTQIKALPEGLIVGGNLNMYGTPIKTLPEDLQVGQCIILPRGDRYYSIQEARVWLKKHYPEHNEHVNDDGTLKQSEVYQPARMHLG